MSRNQKIARSYINANHEESMRIRKIDTANQIYAHLTADERWAVELFANYGIDRTDADLRRARKILNKLHKEIASHNFMRRIALASINEETPVETQVGLLPYVISKAPSEIDLTVNKKELTDDELDARIQELTAEVVKQQDGS